jgi:bleomycin hydrolase
MKFNYSFLILFVFTSSFLISDEKKNDSIPDAYQFKIIKQLPTTSVKDQYRSGTCWSFSGLSFLESEILRMGKQEVNLSEMFVVRTNYTEKAKNYIRYHGKMNFGPGGNFHDNLSTLINYGLIPEDAYKGTNYGEKKHTHGELDAVLQSYLDAIVRNGNGKLSTKWLQGYNGILDAYLGAIPDNFEFNGKSYTPKSYAKELGIIPDDYIEITSFSHHPYYKPFVLELPDNWKLDLTYNVQLDDMINIIDNSIENGYTVAWGGDVSSKGFAYKKQGLAVSIKEDFDDLKGSEMSKWENLTDGDKQDSLYNFKVIREEKVITPEMRQEAFDRWDVTDDHGMHIVGIAEDQKGNNYYYTKNSWNGNSNKYKGYLYMSEPFVKLNTTSIMVNKKAIPEDIKKKLGI